MLRVFTLIAIRLESFSHSKYNIIIVHIILIDDSCHYLTINNLQLFPEGNSNIQQLSSSHIISTFFPLLTLAKSHIHFNIVVCIHIDHKDSPQRHLWIPALSQRQLSIEWPAHHSHLIPYTYTYILSYIITLHYQLFTRFSLFVWDFQTLGRFLVRSYFSNISMFRYIILLLGSWYHSKSSSFH